MEVPVTVPSPYVRRQWLAQQIRQLRAEHRCSGDELARDTGFPRQHLSWLENGHSGPDIDLVSAICDYLRVGDARRQALLAAASDGWTRGWWEAESSGMGRRQGMHAALESGTKRIAEYALALPPGLLQTPDFAAARMRSDPGSHAPDFDPAKAIAARARRQQLLLARRGPQYDLVFDVFAVERLGAPPAIVADQLRHIAAVAMNHTSITVRVLPVDAPIQHHTAPQSAYTIYRYHDEHQTLAVAATTLDTDLIIIERSRIDAYLELHCRLTAAALAPGDSIALLNTVADRIDRQENPHGHRLSQLA
jgi:transcriptional regulator with XRE-family HTH domain